MKQICTLLAAVLLTAGLAACGGADSASAAPSPTPDPATAESGTLQESQSGNDAAAGDASGATVPASEPAEPDAELAKLMEDIYAVQDPGLGVATVAVDPADTAWLGYYTGLESADGIDAAVASESMISSQAYSVVLVRAAEGADAAKLAESMLNGVDPIKWVCVQADDLRAVASGRYAMVAMMDSAFADSVTTEQLSAAFLQAVGGEASFEATRTPDPDAVPEGAVGVG